MRAPPWKRVHLVGVGGTGLSGLARLLHESGVEVTGTDRVETPTLGGLRSLGIDIRVGEQDVSCIGEGIGCLVRSAAVGDDDPEVAAALGASVPVMKYAEAVGRLVEDRRLCAVSGTHGKTTTSGMLVDALAAGGISPGFLIGGERVAAPATGAAAGADDRFVLEACEYDRSFLNYSPFVAGVTSADPDHLDYFGSESAFMGAFEEFLARVRPGGSIVLMESAWKLKAPKGVNVVKVGRGIGADWSPEKVELLPDRTLLSVRSPQGLLDPVSVNLPGTHNVSNAILAAAMAHAAGIDAGSAMSGAGAFAGMRRRFEVNSWRDGYWVDDYAHHPLEITALIDAARQRFPERRICLVFQPHQYVRTKLFLRQFAASLACVDMVILPPIYGVREAGVSGVDHRLLAGEVRAAGGSIRAVESLQEAREAAEATDPGTVVVCAGAGDIWEISPFIGS